MSVFILTIGLAATTRTENVSVGGYYPGIIVGEVEITVVNIRNAVLCHGPDMPNSPNLDILGNK